MNGWLGQAPLKTVERPALGWHSPSAQGLYRPPPIKFPVKLAPSLGTPYRDLPTNKRMGDDSSFLNPSVGTSFLMMAGGVAGLYFSTVFPSPMDSVAKGLGISVAAWGGYSLVSRLFGGAGSTELDAKRKSDTTPMAIMSPEAFDKVSGQIILPLTDTVPEIQSDWFTSDYFEIKVLWRNDSNEVGNFKYNILAKSVSGPGLPIPGQTVLEKIIDDSQMTGIPPHLESGATPLKVELFQPPQGGSAAPLSKSGKSTYKIYLRLQKIGPSGPVPVGNSVAFGPFDYKS